MDIIEKELNPIENGQFPEVPIEKVDGPVFSLSASLTRQALGLSEMASVNLTEIVSVACKTSSGMNAKAKIKNGIAEFFANGGNDVRVKFNIRPLQAGSGTPSSENERALTGWGGANLGINGKNLYNVEDGGVSYYCDAGNKYAYTGNVYSIVIPCKPNTKYTVSKKRTSRFKVWTMHEEPAAGVDCYCVVTDNSAESITVTTDSESCYLGAYVWYKQLDESNISKADILATVQVEFGETATEYGPYTGDLYNIPWSDDAGTVYAGDFDCSTGKLSVYPYIASYVDETLVGPWISSLDAYSAEATPSEGAQVVDLGGEPTVYELDPVELETAELNNYVWVDCGNITEVIY